MSFGRREAWLEQIRRAEEEIARIDALEERFGEDDYEDGSVLVFDKTFNNGTVYQHYAAIRSDGLWWTTGPKSNTGYTWERLCDFMSQGVKAVYWAAELRQVG